MATREFTARELKRFCSIGYYGQLVDQYLKERPYWTTDDAKGAARADFRDDLMEVFGWEGLPKPKQQAIFDLLWELTHFLGNNELKLFEAAVKLKVVIG